MCVSLFKVHKYLNFIAVLVLPKTAGSAQTHNCISFIWIIWSTLYVYLCSRIKKQEDIAYDKEVQAFVDMVTSVRSQYKHNVEKTNMGLIISPKIKSTYPAKTSIKVIVRYDRCLTKENMVTFTCDVSTSVVHIIFTVIAELPGTIFFFTITT